MTDQRQAYYNARGYTILSACPGSGKTTSIVNKLYAVSRYCTEQYGKHTGFACLSFTNKACGELMEKYKNMHNETLKYPNLVATIDSFITQNVVLPFWYLCDYCKTKPIIINDKSVLAKIYYNGVIINGKVNEFPAIEFRTFGKMFYTYSPENIVKESIGYTINRKKAEDETLKSYCATAFKYRLKLGYITSQDALWIACNILNKHRNITSALVQRFPYIIVDESQDNSELQFCFFNLLKESGLKNLEFVGDICQSIYDFRNARPEILNSLMNSGEWNVLHLTECRRSNQRIINVYSKFKPVHIPTIYAHGVKDTGIPIIVYRYNNRNIKDVIRHFYSVCDASNLDSRTLLARGDTACRRLAGIDDNEFKFWKSNLPNIIIEAKLLFESDEIDKALHKMRIILAELKFSQYQHIEKKHFIHSIEQDIDYNVKFIKLLRILPSLKLDFSQWTQQTQKLLQTYWQLTDLPDFAKYKRQKGYNMHLMSLEPVEKYYGSRETNSEYHKSVNTIHAVKGASLDAILLFLSENSCGQNISLNDFPKRPIVDMTEKQRMIYVACSRAKHFLAIAIPSSIPDMRIKTTFRSINYEIKAPGLQEKLDL